MVVRGFFFDLDGTLVNTHESNFGAYAQAIKEITGHSVDETLKRGIKSGQNSLEFLPAAVPELSESEITAINARKKEIYAEHLEKSVLNEYLSIFLAKMSEHYVTALLTTAKRQNALAVLKRHDLEKYFTFMIFGEEVTRMKPDPEVYEVALKKAGLGSDEVLAFEDSPKGLEAAERAGIQTIHIRNFI